MRTHYRFDHSWHVDAGADAVLALLEDVRGYGAWWPAVRVTGGSLGAARTADLEVRAPLGYRLRITLTEEEVQRPGELRAVIRGDLDGWSSWRVTPERAGSRIDFAQEVEARGPVLRAASPLLHGLFARQHAAVMRSAEHGMRAAL
ncbi:SRPBCC family protein [Agrococcus sp. DT81.2]|uniref:SRPBCC family protein n=1 Tax=Agrococcus sp. DT81.2 TaxID=3393414 RepID=UPI003CE508AD